LMIALTTAITPKDTTSATSNSAHNGIIPPLHFFLRAVWVADLQHHALIVPNIELPQGTVSDAGRSTAPGVAPRLPSPAVGSTINRLRPPAAAVSSAHLAPSHTLRLYPACRAPSSAMAERRASAGRPHFRAAAVCRRAPPRRAGRGLRVSLRNLSPRSTVTVTGKLRWSGGWGTACILTRRVRARISGSSSATSARDSGVRELWSLDAASYARRRDKMVRVTGNPGLSGPL
jgi:hypothetical protein